GVPSVDQNPPRSASFHAAVVLRLKVSRASGPGGGGGLATRSVAEKLSTRNVWPAAVSSFRARMPTAAAVCSAPVESVVLSVHDEGSAVPSSQARARTLVGLTPWNCTRSQTTTPLDAGTPVSRSGLSDPPS